ncbi:MAG TPA: hypothetical protein VFL90_20275 [Methylomirabilota bacterium]|nr:hypothetical protein [Methylomirabilota bacterium]
MCDTAGVEVPRPRWGVLYGATLSQLTALALVEVASPPNPLRTLLRFVLGLGAFAGMAAWLRANRGAVDLQDWCECAGRQMIVRVIESRRPGPATVPRPEPAVTASAVDEEHELAHR